MGNGKMSTSICIQLPLLLVLLCLVGKSLEQGTGHILDQFRGGIASPLVGNRGVGSPAQQVIVPGNFQSFFSPGSFPPGFPIPQHNQQPQQHLQHQQQQQQQQHRSQQHFSHSNSGKDHVDRRPSASSQPSSNPQDYEEVQYEYYDDPEYQEQISNEEPSSGGSSSRKNKGQKSFERSKGVEDGSTSIEPLHDVDHELEDGDFGTTGDGFTGNGGRSVSSKSSSQQHLNSRNLNPTVQINPSSSRFSTDSSPTRSKPKSSRPRHEPELSLSAPKQQQQQSRDIAGSRSQRNRNIQQQQSTKSRLGSGSGHKQKQQHHDEEEEDYTIEYVNGDDYANASGGPLGGKGEAEVIYYDKSGEEIVPKNNKPPRPTKSGQVHHSTKTKVTVSVSTKSSSTTESPVHQTNIESSDENTSGGDEPSGIVISVATTKSVSSEKEKLLTPTTPSPRVTFSRATGSSIVVASVQTSKSVETGGNGLSGSSPSNDHNYPTGPAEYFEEEYTYPDNYPVLITDNAQPSDKSPQIRSEKSSPPPPQQPTESIMDKLDRVQSDLVNGVLSGLNEESKQISSTTVPSKAPPISKKPIARLNIESLLKDAKSGAKSSQKSSTSGQSETTGRSRPAESSTLNNILSKIEFQETNLASLLPKGFKLPSNEEKREPPPAFIPIPVKRDKAYNPHAKPSTTTTSTTTSSTTTEKLVSSTPPAIIDKLIGKIEFSDDISAFLPPGYKMPSSTPQSTTSATTTTTTQEAIKEKKLSGIEAIIPGIKFDDVSNLLPSNYKPRGDGPTFKPPPPITTTTVSSNVPVSKAEDKSSVKLVFPTRPGSKPSNRPTTEAPKVAETPEPPKVVIGSGWPTRKTTEFTGWPTSSTLPTTRAPTTTTTPEPTTRRTTVTTTTTTPAPPKRARVAYCTIGAPVCKMEATLRIIGGVRWKPEYAAVNTEEWKQLELVMKRELDGAFRSSGLAPYYRSVEIEAFNKGSVLVDYFVLLGDVDQALSTTNVRAYFHAALFQSSTLPPVDDPGQLSNQPPDERLMLGRYTIDPRYTDFKVRNSSAEVPSASTSEALIPQWGIAVIVIGLASLMFVVIFGVTVLVNRHRNSKKKNTISLTQEMLSEFNKTHMGVDNYGADDLYNMDDVWENSKQLEKSFDRKPTKRSSNSGKGSTTNYNIYDSWKSEWNGYYYNGNYYGDSGTGTGTGTGTGYTPRRRSDYDTNF